MNRGVKKLWVLGSSSLDNIVDQIGVTRDEVMSDFKEFRSNYKERLDELLEEWAEDETIFELFEGFVAMSEKGWDATVAYLRKKSDELQGYLGKQTRLTPHLVGGVDGFLQVYLATPAKRWVRSPRYRKGVKIGRIVGVICAFTVFLPVSIGRAMIGMLPGASRIAKYFAEKWAAAKEERRTRAEADDSA